MRGDSARYRSVTRHLPMDAAGSLSDGKHLMSFFPKISLHLCALVGLAVSSALAAPEEKPTAAAQAAAESKRANEFLDQKFNEEGGKRGIRVQILTA